MKTYDSKLCVIDSFDHKMTKNRAKYKTDDLIESVKDKINQDNGYENSKEILIEIILIMIGDLVFYTLSGNPMRGVKYERKNITETLEKCLIYRVPLIGSPNSQYYDLQV